MKRFHYLIFAAMLLVLVSCQKQPSGQSEAKKLPSIVEAIPHAVIYEVNLRQFTPEGTIDAFEAHLPRLKNLGVDILWFMPIHPISEKKRKGSLGSYYAVANYKEVNPEYGTFDDFKQLVEKVHDMGMYVVLDWVANHTGWDNPWIIEHPEWYTHNEQGEIIAPVEDWTDVADLNYDVPAMRTAMIDAMKFWVSEANIDGYRCDVAGSVPVDFWDAVRDTLDAVKPVFMLAEAWEPELLHHAFQLAYGWNFHHIMNSIAKGTMGVPAIDDYYAEYMKQYQDDDVLMQFITNHDENSWNGTEYERMGDAVNTFAVLSYIAPGMPLIYTGQEAGLNERLVFFDKDEVNWSDTSLYSFYRKLNTLKKNPALWAGINGGQMVRLEISDTNIYGIVRHKDNDVIVALMNFSDDERSFELNNPYYVGSYNSLFDDTFIDIGKLTDITLPPYGYKVYVKQDVVTE